MVWLPDACRVRQLQLGQRSAAASDSAGSLRSVRPARCTCSRGSRVGQAFPPVPLRSLSQCLAVPRSRRSCRPWATRTCRCCAKARYSAIVMVRSEGPRLSARPPRLSCRGVTCRLFSIHGPGQEGFEVARRVLDESRHGRCGPDAFGGDWPDVRATPEEGLRLKGLRRGRHWSGRRLKLCPTTRCGGMGATG